MIVATFSPEPSRQAVAGALTYLAMHRAIRLAREQAERSDDPADWAEYERLVHWEDPAPVAALEEALP